MESMMEKLCGTRTEENLRTAFAGESQARNKYTYYAKKAEEDGMNQIAEIFRIRKIPFQHGGNCGIVSRVPCGNFSARLREICHAVCIFADKPAFYKAVHHVVHTRLGEFQCGCNVNASRAAVSTFELPHGQQIAYV